MLAYGQTGSGKTFTISGILDRIAFDLFKERDPNAIRIHVSMFELLGSQVFFKEVFANLSFFDPLIK
jgi:hypothetical protein